MYYKFNKPILYKHIRIKMSAIFDIIYKKIIFDKDLLLLC